MTHGRKPRRRRPEGRNLVAFVIARATRHTAAEIEQIVAPMRAANKALREGVATEAQWAVLVTAVAVGAAIEHQGVIRGLTEHIKAADLALDEISKRALASGTWQPVQPHLQELDDVDQWVDLHVFQLEQLSAGELQAAHRLAGDRARAAGARVRDFEQTAQQGVLV